MRKRGNLRESSIETAARFLAAHSFVEKPGSRHCHCSSCAAPRISITSKRRIRFRRSCGSPTKRELLYEAILLHVGYFPRMPRAILSEVEADLEPERVVKREFWRMLRALVDEQKIERVEDGYRQKRRSGRTP